MRLLIAVDKFRGTATARQVTSTIAATAIDLGWDVTSVTLADGGEGMLEAFGGSNRSTEVTGPLGLPVIAPWRIVGDIAVIESARASGLLLAGGIDRNDPMSATSRGTGELIAEALQAGATKIIVGLGGSSMTDGGAGALVALEPWFQTLFAGIAQIIACHDVDTRFLDAAAVFAPQKGASPEQVNILAARLAEVRTDLIARFGFDPHGLPGSGAAGGLAGSLAAIGGTLRPGLDVIASHVGLDTLVRSADLIFTGEGKLDGTSMRGKVVGGVARRAAAAGVPVVAIAGVTEIDDALAFEAISLTDKFGPDRSWDDVLGCLRQVATEQLLARGT